MSDFGSTYIAVGDSIDFIADLFISNELEEVTRVVESGYRSTDLRV